MDHVPPCGPVMLMSRGAESTRPSGASARPRRTRARVAAVVEIGCQTGRQLDPLDLNGEHISDATLGLDDSGRAGVALELASEAKNLHVDAAIEDVLMHARGLQQLLTAKWALRRIEKGKQQGVLALGQGHGSAVWVGELPGPSVELPAGKLKAATLGIARWSGASFLEPS